jgi:hypothetical protein
MKLKIIRSSIRESMIVFFVFFKSTNWVVFNVTWHQFLVNCRLVLSKVKNNINIGLANVKTPFYFLPPGSPINLIIPSNTPFVSLWRYLRKLLKKLKKGDRGGNYLNL